MPIDPSASERSLRPILSIVLLIAGIALIAWSFIWASVATGRSAWSPEQARDYQAAAEKLHSLSHQYTQEAARGNEAAVRGELQQAQTEYDALRADLESAMGRPRYVAWLVRLVGLLLLGVGVVGLMMPPSPASAQR